MGQLPPPSTPKLLELVRAQTTLDAFVLANVLEGLVRAAKEAKDSTCSFQAYGFGLGTVAELAIEFLSKNRSSAVKESIERENNPIVAARTVTVNVQPYKSGF
ncbi:hypothetical protein PGT21_017050 [Puccinia graminis f. sp. tritici]|uniref:Uncharacterized protein n=1 Tax=Puccinia graminis f. sp. tritici TaxID=56615 RepID=A0A5B0NKX1_PUCGR|nr:hypothetical protein PGT21_017050 [Puccinia graminis f. sp. tritici]